VNQLRFTVGLKYEIEINYYIVHKNAHFAMITVVMQKVQTFTVYF